MHFMHKYVVSGMNNDNCVKVQSEIFYWHFKLEKHEILECLKIFRQNLYYLQ